jgi:hypothetical protein
MAAMIRAPRILFVFTVAVVLSGCGPGAAPVTGVSAVTEDSTLTHAVLIFENPLRRPVMVTLRRPGFSREFTVAPRSALRQLVPEGPMVVVWPGHRREVILRARTRGTLRLEPAEEK